jgi:hypothetical protein
MLVPAGLGPSTLGSLALSARGRHLLKGAFERADDGDTILAAMAVRAMAETALTLAWLNVDPELAELVWSLDEVRTRLSQHREVAALERKERRRARRRGDHVPPLAPGGSLGILTRTSVRNLRRLERETQGRVKALPRRARRLARLKVSNNLRVPPLRQRASVAKADMLYSLSYRFDSNFATHPTSLAAEQFLERHGEDILIRATPHGPAVDPYAAGAILLLALIDLAGERVDQTALAPELDVIRATVNGLPRP